MGIYPGMMNMRRRMEKEKCPDRKIDLGEDGLLEILMEREVENDSG